MLTGFADMFSVIACPEQEDGKMQYLEKKSFYFGLPAELNY